MTAKSHHPDADADVPPHVIRQVLQLVASRGHSPERLCKGLGMLTCATLGEAFHYLVRHYHAEGSWD